MLQPGQLAPTFSLPDADMENFDLASLRGKQHAVIFFYPKDGTPYCTREAIEFSDHETEFNRLDCVIVGVSRDDCLAHAEFSDKNGLSVRLLSDVDGKVGHQYGVYQYREQDGHKKLTVLRSTFVIDKQGIIRHALYEVPPKGHAAEVFQLVKQLNGSRQPCKSQKTP
jgi:thioredoxin-dependent peroxiredoxin